MTDRNSTTRKPNKKVKVDKLELSKETVKELADTQSERVEGGAAGEKCRGSMLTADGAGC